MRSGWFGGWRRRLDRYRLSRAALQLLELRHDLLQLFMQQTKFIADRQPAKFLAMALALLRLELVLGLFHAVDDHADEQVQDYHRAQHDERNEVHGADDGPRDRRAFSFDEGLHFV